eukprot:163027-Pleurochrysis_carterae.AAC.1
MIRRDTEWHTGRDQCVVTQVIFYPPRPQLLRASLLRAVRSREAAAELATRKCEGSTGRERDAAMGSPPLPQG